MAAPSAVAVVRGVGTDFYVLHLLLGPVFVVVVVIVGGGWIGRFGPVSQSVILKYPEDRRQPIPTHTSITKKDPLTGRRAAGDRGRRRRGPRPRWRTCGASAVRAP